MNTKPYLSIVVPVYNEANRLATLPKLSEFVADFKYPSELVIINDGSTDGTQGKLKKLSRKFKFNLINNRVNKGKGHAIKTGMIEAKGKFRLFTDIDLSTPIEEFEKFIPHLKAYDVIIGSRKMPGSKLKVRQAPTREFLGKGFTFLTQVLLDLSLSDFTCGFKCFSEKASNKIFTNQQIERWGFDSEILFLAKKLGFGIKEVPVTWSDDQRTKVKFPKDIVNSFSELMRIRYYYLSGRYEL